MSWGIWGRRFVDAVTISLPCCSPLSPQILADLNSPNSKYVDSEGYVQYDQAYFVNVLMSAKEAKATKGRRTFHKIAPPCAVPNPFS